MSFSCAHKASKRDVATSLMSPKELCSLDFSQLENSESFDSPMLFHANAEIVGDRCLKRVSDSTFHGSLSSEKERILNIFENLKGECNRSFSLSQRNNIQNFSKNGFCIKDAAIFSTGLFHSSFHIHGEK